MSSGISVQGQVTDGAGAPLNNVDVSFRPSASGVEFGKGTTDVAGNYTATMSAGTWVAVVDPGVSTLGTVTVGDLAVAAPGPVTFNFQFAPTVAVTGTVSEAFGPAIPGTQLDFTGTQSGSSISVVCDGLGTYATNLIPDTYTVEATPSGASATTHPKQKLTVEITGPGIYDLSLIQGVTLSGTVRDSLGLVLFENTDVSVELPASSSFFPPANVTTNPLDGSYSIGPVPTGNVRVVIEPPGSSGYPLQEFKVNVAAPPTQSEDFLLAAGFVLSGMVVQDDGLSPEADAEIAPLPANEIPFPEICRTDVTGMFEISVFRGNYTVDITPDPANLQVSHSVTVKVTADTALNVTLARGALVTGTVTQPGGVIPEPGVRVSIPGIAGAEAVTDALGVYSFLAPAGTHTLTVAAESGTFKDFALVDQTGVVVTTPGPVTQDIEMTLATTGSTVVLGTVFEPDGTTPAVGAEITARDPLTGDALGRATSTAGGLYLLVIP